MLRFSFLSLGLTAFCVVHGGCDKVGDLGKDSDGQGTSDDGVATMSDDGTNACDAPEACGPAPGAPNYLCEDGVTVAGPGPCAPQPDGSCAWEWVECPTGTGGNDGAETSPTDSGGSSTGGDGCDCQLGAYIPACGVDGMTYDATCGTQCVPVEIACMSECPCPGEDTGSSSGGDVCMDLGESCASGEPCCATLECCAGVPVPPGDEYCSDNCPISDRNKKENFRLVDPQEILDKVATLPITTWNYRFEDASIRHIGAMAQDFKATFRVGATDKSIFVIDADGVALASIQALNEKLRTAEKENASLRTELDTLEQRLQALEASIAAR